MQDTTDGSAHLDGLAQDAPDAPREQQVPSATPQPSVTLSPGTYWVALNFGDGTTRVYDEKGNPVPDDAPSLPDT